MGLNRVVLIGETTRAPEVTQDMDGRPAASLEILCERIYTTPEGAEKTASTRVPLLAVADAFDASRVIRGAGEMILVEGRLFIESKKGDDGKWSNRQHVLVYRLDVITIGGAYRQREAQIQSAVAASPRHEEPNDVARPIELRLEQRLEPTPPAEVPESPAAEPSVAFDAAEVGRPAEVVVPRPPRRTRPPRPAGDLVGAGRSSS